MPTLIQISDFLSHPHADDRKAAVRKTARRLDFEAQADQALASYFARPAGSALTPEHAKVHRALTSLLPHRRSALAMFHRDRVWPEALKKRCGRHTSLVVRLYCNDHPAVGSTRELEAAAAEQLVAMLTATVDHDDVIDLQERAELHFKRARRRFHKALRAPRSAAR